MTLNLAEDIEVNLPFDYQQVARDVIEEALTYEHFPYDAEVSLTLTDEDSIHEMNRQFRNIDRATDVLSFPLIEYPAAGDFSELNDESDIFDPDTGEAMLGDIVLSIPRVISQAEEYGHSVKREFAFLIAHSMLHLLGYDHMNEDERRVMESRQNQILENLGITRDVP